MLSRKLQPNQRTNGVFIFTIPKGFTCERQQFKEKLPIDPLFEIHNKYVGSAGLTAFYLSDEYTEKVYRSWEKEILKNFDDVSPQLIAEGQENINGNTCTYRIRKIEKKGETVFWRTVSLLIRKKRRLVSYLPSTWCICRLYHRTYQIYKIRINTFLSKVRGEDSGKVAPTSLLYIIA